MSGIAGFIHFDGKPAEPELVKKMTASMDYRGPDGIHHWVKGPAALGQCMLRTTPESLEETQPLINEDGSLVLVMDGRVDNWQQLRKELQGRNIDLRDRSDAELVLKAYETWGPGCLAHIDGDFALVIWNTKTKTVFCARDPIGNKPFYYHWNGKTFSFASELHPIFALPWVKHDLNNGMLAEFLGGERYSLDETFWLGILRLPPAHRMDIRTGKLLSTQYWSPDLEATLTYKKEEEFVEHYLELFTDIVTRMSRSHSAIACEVSGGLDSSAIFSMSKHLLRQGSLHAPAINGYTLGFHDETAANELRYAHAVGKFWDTEIRETEPAQPPVAWYRQWADHYKNIPPYPNGSMGLSIRSAAAAQNTRVLFSGVGGDEWLWGDRSYYQELLRQSQWPALYRILKRDMKETRFLDTAWWFSRYGIAPCLPDTVKKSLHKISKFRKTHSSLWLTWLSPPMQDLLQQRRTDHLQAWKNISARSHQLSHIMRLNNAFNIHARESEEQLAAGQGIELRLPFWQKDMVQFSFSTPEQWKLRGYVNRTIHRKAMSGLLPDLILQRHSKADFMCTYQRPLKELKRDKAEYFPEITEKLWDNCNDAHSYGLPEWMLWTLFSCDCVALSSTCFSLDDLCEIHNNAPE